MASAIEKNKNIFITCGVPFTEIDDKTIKIVTDNTDYHVSLKPIGNNPYFFLVLDKTSGKNSAVSKEVFLRKMCRYFKIDFKHWDTKAEKKQEEYIKIVPDEIVEGRRYTTHWANPLATWVLKEILDGNNVLLVSPKSGRELLSTIPDLRVWKKQN
jgi:hypothetical protein